MSFFLIVHKLSLFISMIMGIIGVFKWKDKIKKIHGLIGLITVIAIFIYLLLSRFDSFGYSIYGMLLMSAYVVGKYSKNKRAFLWHIMIFVISIIWLVIIHVV